MPPTRLIEVATTKLVEYFDPAKPYPPYAILSHRWRRGEVVFKDLKSGQNSIAVRDVPDSSSRTKLLNACTIAQRSSIKYIWADTVCIDKSDSPELQEALNCMFMYYAEAERCIAFIDDVLVSSGLGKRLGDDDVVVTSPMPGGYRVGMVSEWFERGWTLQELVAPRKMDFYDKRWQFMGTKDTLAGQIERITGIANAYLNDQNLVLQASVATKMSWMAGRTTTKPEDIAYGLLGLLKVYLSPNYGEGGKRAFSRLQETLLSSPSFDESLFAWTINPELTCIGINNWAPEGKRWGLLAPSPDCFKGSRNIVEHVVSPRRGDGFRATSQGVSFEHCFRQWSKLWSPKLLIQRDEMNFVLNCARQDDQHNMVAVVIELKKTVKGGEIWMREQCNKLGEERNPKKLDGRVLGLDQGPTMWFPLTVKQIA